MAGAAGSDLSRGGMQTKIEAGKIATTAGAHMVIAPGKREHPLEAIAAGGPCTWFLAAGNPVKARKKWIAGSLEPKGTLFIDAGAVAALRRGKSLLPAGVRRVEGEFFRGDAVLIRDLDGHEIGRGLSAYDAGDAARILGKSSGDIALSRESMAVRCSTGANASWRRPLGLWVGLSAVISSGCASSRARSSFHSRSYSASVISGRFSA